MTRKKNQHEEPEVQPQPQDEQAGAASTADGVTAEINVDYKDMAMRAQADYQNLQKEIALQRSQWAKMSKIYVLEEFIPVLENFKKAYAYESGTDPAQFENWKKGIGFIKKQFEDIIAQHGVESIDTVGKPFDPTLHDAAGEETSDTVPEGTIIREVEGGYRAGEAILRPAKVIVSTGEQS